MEYQSSVDSRVESVKGSDRLLWVKQAVDPCLLSELNDIDWCGQPCVPDMLHRGRLMCNFAIQSVIDRHIQSLIPEINRLTGQQYRYAQGTWMLCTSGYTSVRHTDGHKPNLLLIYWQVPGSQYGTTFYNSEPYRDVYHEFLSLPNTGFFANYEPAAGEPWPKMWHASPVPVPPDSYRLISQYQLVR